MAKSVGLSVKVGADLGGLQKGTRLARNEVRQLGSIMRQAETPAEKLEKKTNLLERALRSGELTNEEYAKSLKHIKNRYGETSAASSKLGSDLSSQIPMVGRLTSTFSSGLHPAALGVGVAIGGISLAATTATTAIGVLVGSSINKMQELDSTIKSARSIGAEVGDLQRLQFGLGESTGVGPAEVEKSLSGLGRRIAETAMGTGEAAKAFEMLGLSVADLQKMDPTQQFKAVGEAIQGVDNKTQQLYIANKLFEEQGAKLLPGLLAQGDGFDKAAAAADLYGLTLNDVDGIQIEMANDAMGRMQSVWEGITTQVGVELAPVITQIGQTIETMLTSMGGVRLQAYLFGVALNEATVAAGKTFYYLDAAAKASAGESDLAVAAIMHATTFRTHLDYQRKQSMLAAEAQAEQQRMDRETSAAAKSLNEEVHNEKLRSMEEEMATRNKMRRDSQKAMFEEIEQNQKKAAEKQSSGVPSTLEAGSQQAYQFITGQMRDNEKLQLEESEKQTEFLELIQIGIDTMARNNGPKIGVVT